MTRHHHRTSIGGASVAIALLMCSLLSFGLGQEARHLVRALGLAPRLDQAIARQVVSRQVVSRQAVGALGASLPAPPKRLPTHRTTARASLPLRHATRSTQTTRRTAKAPPDRSLPPGLARCPEGTTLIAWHTSWQVTRYGESRSSVTVCAGDGVNEVIGAPAMPQPPSSQPIASPEWPPANPGYEQPPMPPPSYAADWNGGPPADMPPPDSATEQAAPPASADPADGDDSAMSAAIPAYGAHAHGAHVVSPPVMVSAPDAAR